MATKTAPKFTRDEIHASATEMAKEMAAEMVERIMKAHDTLTDDELSSVDSDTACARPVFVVRALAMAIGDKVLSNQFAAEATKPHTRRIKTILSKRYW